MKEVLMKINIINVDKEKPLDLNNLIGSLYTTLAAAKNIPFLVMIKHVENMLKINISVCYKLFLTSVFY